jgi:hypothetical protein
MAEEGEARYRSGPFASYRAHLEMLIREAAPDADHQYLADVMLAVLRAEHLRYLRRNREMPQERIAAGWEDFVRRLLSCR